MHQHDDEHPSDPQGETEASREDQPAAITPDPPEDTASPLGDEVMNILSGVEQQVEKLREVQRSHDAGLISLAERSRTLDDAERNLKEQTGQLQAEREALQQQRDELARQMTQLETERQKSDDRQAELEHQRQQLNQRQTNLTEQEEDLQSQWEEFGALKTQLEAQRQQLNQRNNELAEQEQDLRRRREEFDSQQTELEAQREELSQRETQLSGQHSDLQQQQEELHSRETQLQARQQNIDGQQEACEDDRKELDQRRSELTQQEEDLQRQWEEFNAFQAQLEARQQELNASQTELTARKEQLGRRWEEFNSQRSDWEQQREQDDAARAELTEEIAERERELEDRLTELNEERQRVEALDTELNALRDQLDAERKELKQRAESLEAEHTDLQNRLEQAESNANEAVQLAEQYEEKLAEKAGECQGLSEKLQQTHRRCEEAESELDNHRERLESQSDEIARLQEFLQERDTVVSDYEEKLKLAGGKLKDFAEALSEQTTQLERGAAALAMVEHQQQQIARLTGELAELRTRVDPEELQRKDRRIAELTGALRQARGQTAGGSHLAALEQRNEELTVETDRLRLELESATIAAQQNREQLEQHLAQTQSGEVNRTDQALQIAELTAQIERVTDHLRLQEQLLEEVRAAESTTDAEYQQRIEALELELAEARAATGEASATDPADLEKQNRAMEELRQKARRVAAVAEHLRRRRRRLSRARILMRERSSQPTPSTDSRQLQFDQMRQVEERHRQLVDVREMLAASEQKMIRKWARPRAIGTFGWMMVLAVIVAGASWLGTNHYFPATISASVTVEAESRTSEPLDDGGAEKWRIWHTQIFSDDSFRQTLAKRMAERRLDQYGSPEAIGARLDRDLAIYDGETGRITLTLAGTNKVETAAVLDIIASTLMQESKRQAANRSDGAWAVVLNARKEQGRIRYASFNDLPVKDERLNYFGPIFGGGFLLSLLIICLIYARLVKAKRVFDEQGVLPASTE